MASVEPSLLRTGVDESVISVSTLSCAIYAQYSKQDDISFVVNKLLRLDATAIRTPRPPVGLDSGDGILRSAARAAGF